MCSQDYNACTFERAAELLNTSQSGLKWYIRNGYVKAYGSYNNRRVLVQSIHWFRWWQESQWPDGRKPEGYIYLLHSHHAYKIGMASHVKKRLQAINGSSPTPVKLIHSVPTDNMIRAEKYLHGLYAAKRKHFEWFELRARDVALICNSKAMYFGDQNLLT